MTKKIHIIGVCGTFMGGIAKLAKELGFHVQGSDQNTYPPMSTQLESLGIDLFNGYNESNITDDIDIVIIGNTISRGNPELEHVLNNKISFTSGAQWLSENILNTRWVLAISGTHGKTTSSSLLAWILDFCGYKPGFLIGGVPENFGVSARLGESDFFVIEADEYDTAFSDKRSKFIHYHPSTLVINNLEFDHADIFDDVNAIKTQFHHLIKTIPSNGQIIFNAEVPFINDTLKMGVWSELCGFNISRKDGNDLITKNTVPFFTIEALNPDGSKFLVTYKNTNDLKSTFNEGKWDLIGEHNLNNAIAAIAAAHHVGVPVEHACAALTEFKSVKRRLELKGIVNNISVYDDFAHHPTAIKSTIQGLKASIGKNRLIAVIEPRSNTMKLGTHKEELKSSIETADMTYFLISDEVSWDTDTLKEKNTFIYSDVESLIKELTSVARPNDHILMMSNGSFSGIHNRLLNSLS
jgi:UDP-N-acetylmuramate: L-alanyl-gamma-D-glutamyl-meso-diaminopimelate ligase